MKDYLVNLFQEIEAFSPLDILVNIIIAALLGMVIYLSYYLSHSGGVYSRKFNVSLVVLTILTATVIAVIGNNIALSLGMVGALSIVRFRTAIKDSRDTVYIFWCIVGGMACGIGSYAVAGIGSAAVFLVLLLLGRIKNDNRALLIVRGARNTSKRLKATVTNYFDRKVDLRVENSTEDTVELIYEISRKLLTEKENSQQSIIDLLYEIEQVEYVNIVTQDDDISS